MSRNKRLFLFCGYESLVGIYLSMQNGNTGTRSPSQMLETTYVFNLYFRFKKCKKQDDIGHFDSSGLTLIPAKVSNYIHNKKWY